MLFWRDRHKVREEDLSAYVDGELNVSALNRLEAHLKSCTACRETVAELRSVRQSVKELPRATAPRSFVLREADVAAAPTPAGGGLFGSVTPLLSGVAAIAIVAFVVLAGFDITSDNDEFGNRSGRTSGATLPLTADSERMELAPSAESAVPPAVGERDGDETDGDDEVNGDAYNYASDDEPLADGGLDGQRGITLGQEVALAEGSSETGLRIAEAVAAGIAAVAGGAVLVIWWRRRTVIA